MISIGTARGGQPVIQKNGRWLASSFDPVREAQAWAKKASLGVKHGESIFILGLGSGYHVAELAKLRSEPFLVFENDELLTEQALEICPEIRERSIIVDGDWTKLLENDTVRDQINGVYHIAKYGPSCQMSPEYFAQVENLLIGRDPLTFLLQLKARPGIWGILDGEKVRSLGSAQSNDPISIKTLQKLFAENANGSKERQMWRVLEELVA